MGIWVYGYVGMWGPSIFFFRRAGNGTGKGERDWKDGDRSDCKVSFCIPRTSAKQSTGGREGVRG